MPKSNYKIPYGLDASYGDMTISFRSKDGLGTKPIPLKVIMGYLISVVLCFFIVSNTVIGTGNIPQIGGFVILWVLLTLVLVKHDGTHRMQIELIPTLINYLGLGNRQVITRASGSAEGMYSIYGIASISAKGLIEFTDGTFGYCYRVVGSASILLFESDKNQILDRVDRFYRKMNTESEVIFITAKSAQTVYKQVNALKRRFDNLRVRDKELLDLAENQFKCLKNYVGSTFKSIHQYMIIKVDNRELLQQTKNVLQSEVENSTLMIRRCVAMYPDDIDGLMRQIYRGKAGES